MILNLATIIAIYAAFRCWQLSIDAIARLSPNNTILKTIYTVSVITAGILAVFFIVIELRGIYSAALEMSNFNMPDIGNFTE